MHDRANEIASIKVRLEELRQALEQIRTNPDLTEDEQTLHVLWLRREMLIMQDRWTDILLSDCC